MTPSQNMPANPKKIRQLNLAGVAFVFMYFMFGGIGHFVFTPFFVNIVPPYIVWAHAVVYISGVFEILGALGLCIPALRRLAGWGLFALTLAVTPANIHMLLNSELYPDFPPAVLVLRLVIQVGLLWLIWWSTKPTKQLS